MVSRSHVETIKLWNDTALLPVTIIIRNVIVVKVSATKCSILNAVVVIDNR